MKRILFILKERHYSQAKTSYGLINSATLVANYLTKKGYECKVVEVVDANFIDREIHLFRPDTVILEALWVPTYKLDELMQLRRHHHIKWVVRVHSDIGFLSVETQGIRFLNEYIGLHQKDLTIALNNYQFVESLSSALNYKFTYLPNIVIIQKPGDDFLEEHRHIDIGCFGAMRILKNQCFQALCAMWAASYLDKKLFFHITPNLSIENDPVLANLIELFKNSKHHLVIHDWLPNDEFQQLIKKMDFGMQLSFTESFNIISADFINNNRLIIVSDAIDWLPAIVRTSTTNYAEAIKKIIYAYNHRNSNYLKGREKVHLSEYNEGAEKKWTDFLHSHHNKH
jgi:hypothetical protein